VLSIVCHVLTAGNFSNIRSGVCRHQNCTEWNDRCLIH